MYRVERVFGLGVYTVWGRGGFLGLGLRGSLGLRLSVLGMFVLERLQGFGMLRFNLRLRCPKQG